MARSIADIKRDIEGPAMRQWMQETMAERSVVVEVEPTEVREPDAPAEAGIDGGAAADEDKPRVVIEEVPTAPEPPPEPEPPTTA
jgi:hypothetical protein